MSIILDILGTPSLDDFYAITSQRSREYIRALPFRKKKSFRYLFPDANPLAVDLLEQLLTFSPKRRIDVEQALKHCQRQTELARSEPELVAALTMMTVNSFPRFLWLSVGLTG